MSPLHSARMGRIILIAMIALTLAHLVFTAVTVRRATIFYGDTSVGSNRREVRYGMGTPTRVLLPSGPTEPGKDGADLERASTWLYPTGGATTQVDFGNDGRLGGISCRDPRLDSFACPAVLGLPIGTGEEQVFYRLGAPDRESYEGDTKLIIYDDLGLTFALRKFQIVAIKLSSGAGSGWLSRLPRILVP